MSDKEKSLTNAKKDRELSLSVLEQFSSNALKAWENPDKIRRVFAPSLNNDEFSFFMGMGIALKANPFKKEIFAVKYDKENPADIVVSRALYRRVAQEQENYGGAIVEALYPNERFAPNKFKPKETVHEIDWIKRTAKDVLPIGAYFFGIYDDNTLPIFHFVKFSEYAKKYRDKETNEIRLQSTWRSMPETMIKKVADSQGHRLMYQGLFSGTTTQDEYDPDIGTGAEVIDDEPEEKTEKAAQIIQNRGKKSEPTPAPAEDDALPEVEQDAEPTKEEIREDIEHQQSIMDKDESDYNKCSKHQWSTEEPYACVVCGADNPSYPADQNEVSNQIEDNVKETEEEQTEESDHEWPEWKEYARKTVLKKFSDLRNKLFVEAAPALKEFKIFNMMQLAQKRYKVDDFNPANIDQVQYEDAKDYLTNLAAMHGE